jgi:hypothetical protein
MAAPKMKKRGPESFVLSPYWEIVAIGMLNPDTGKGAVFFQNNSDPLLPFEEEGIRYEAGSERDIIQRFWETIKSYNQFITFNGRTFDCPFLMIRSAVHKLRPVRDLMPNRYGETHIDLLDQLTFYGASRRKFSLDMWCRTFGIKSPKESGITGYDVKDLYRSGRGLDIAKYCAGDLRATAELFRSGKITSLFGPEINSCSFCSLPSHGNGERQIINVARTSRKRIKGL